MRAVPDPFIVDVLASAPVEPGDQGRGFYLIMQSDLSFSVVIANYNYGQYVAEAIESALGQDWPHVEVVVVDDGSTDNSATVIKGFGDRIAALFQKNAGQREANNAGFARSTGDVVIFLDADDVLLPGLCRAVAEVWRPGLSKVQLMMQRVDAAMNPVGNTIPKTPVCPTPGEIRAWVDATAEYPTPPGSGNAWARTFLKKIFPLDETCDSFTDSTCIAMAPYMGDVETVPKPFVLYRMHGSNDSTMTARDTNYSREVARALKRLEASRRACAIRGITPPDVSVLFRGPHLLQFRVASLRLTPKLHPLPGDSRGRALLNALQVPFRPTFERKSFLLLVMGWCVATLLAPKPLARFFIRKRFS